MENAAKSSQEGDSSQGKASSAEVSELTPSPPDSDDAPATSSAQESNPPPPPVSSASDQADKKSRRQQVYSRASSARSTASTGKAKSPRQATRKAPAKVPRVASAKKLPSKSAPTTTSTQKEDIDNSQHSVSPITISGLQRCMSGRLHS